MTTGDEDTVEFAHRAAWRLAPHSSDAEDAAQDALLAILKRAEAPSGEVRAYLTVAIRNRLRRLWKRQSARRPRELARARGPVPPVDELRSERELSALMATAMARLPAVQRTALYLRYYEGLPPRRIAEMLSVPVGTVKTRLKRGLRQLRAQLDEQPGGLNAWRTCLLPLLGARGRSATSASTAGTLLWAALSVVSIALVWMIVMAPGSSDLRTTPADEATSGAPLTRRGLATQPPALNGHPPNLTNPAAPSRGESAPAANAHRHVISGRIREGGRHGRGALEVRAYRMFSPVQAYMGPAAWRNPPLASTRSDAEGRFALSVTLEPGAPRSLVGGSQPVPTGLLIVAHDDAGPVCGAFLELEEGAEARQSGVELPPTNTVDLRCHVLDAFDRPVAGAHCTLCDDAPCFWPDGRVVAARTDRDGVARIRGFALSGRRALEFAPQAQAVWRVTAEHYAQAVSSPRATIRNTAGRTPTTVRLEGRARTLRCRVVDDTGAPLPKRYALEIDALAPDGARTPLDGPRGGALRIGDDGELVVAGIPARTRSLRVFTYEHAQGWIPLEEVARTKRLELMRRAGPLRIVLGSGASGATQLVRVRGLCETPRARLRWDAEGIESREALVPAWKAGRYTLQIELDTGEEARTLERSVVLRPGSESVIEVTP